MEATYLVLLAVVPIFLLIGCGTLARLFGWLDKNADLSLMKLVINLLYPALIFSNILGNDVLRSKANLIVPPLLGIGTVVLGFTIAWFVANKLKAVSQSDRRTFTFITGIQNSIYFALPITELLFDKETIGILLIYNVGVEIALWMLGVGFILSPKDSKSLLGRIISAPIIAILLATWINYFRFDQELPEFVFKATRLLGQCAIPLGLILIGALFADQKPSIKLFTEFKIPLSAAVVRLFVMPAILLISAFLLPLSTELEKVIIIQAAMPCAVFPIVLTQHYGGSPNIAFKIVLSTTLLSFLTIPIWIRAGINLLGL